MFYMYTVFYSIAFVFLILTCYKPSFRKFHVIAKVICSAGFIGAAILGALQSSEYTLFWRLFPAFIFCFLGDFFLAKKEKQETKQNFLMGLGSFLVGHILFLVGLSVLEPSNIQTFILPLMGVLFVCLLMRLKKMEVGEFKIPVIVYAYFVTALFIKCTQIAVQGDGGPFFILIFMGGLFFLISDLIILFLYFYSKKYDIIKFLNLFTYYMATYLLATAMLFR